MLEELEHARARGAPILAEFLGGSFTCDAHHMTEPQPQGHGVRLCIEKWVCVRALFTVYLVSCAERKPPSTPSKNASWQALSSCASCHTAST